MNTQSKIPLAFSRQPSSNGEMSIVLAGDVGGTKTNLALYQFTENKVDLVREGTYHSANYASAIDVVQQFLSENKELKPERICLGVAGPVIRGKVEMPNLSWNLDSEEIRKAIAAKNVSLINDLEATAYGLAALDEDDFITIHAGAGHYGDNMAILAPGTGLGEGGLYWDGTSYHPFPTEGGHADFSPRTELDIELYQYLQKKYNIVSWEKVIAGPGIHDIYRFLCEVKRRKEEDWVKDLLEKEDPSA